MTRSKPILVYFWIAEFTDGTAIAQYDPMTGFENKPDPDWLPSAPGQPAIPKDPLWEQKRVVRLTWHPFNSGFAAMVRMMADQPCRATENPSYSVDYAEGDVPLLYHTHDVTYNRRTLKLVARETVYNIGKLIDGKRILQQIHEDGSVSSAELES